MFASMFFFSVRELCYILTVEVLPFEILLKIRDIFLHQKIYMHIF